MQLIETGKIRQKATLTILDSIEDWRNRSLDELEEGSFSESKGDFDVEVGVKADSPYPGTWQIKVSVIHETRVIVQSLFYRNS